jgi:hypothetical protein
MSQKAQTPPQLPIEIIKYISTLTFQPPKPLSPSIPVYTLTLEELTCPFLCLKNEFHRKCCTCRHDSFSDYPCCTCEYNFFEYLIRSSLPSGIACVEIPAFAFDAIPPVLTTAGLIGKSTISGNTSATIVLNFYVRYWG